MKLKIGNMGSLRIPDMQDIRNIFSDRYAAVNVTLLSLDWVILSLLITVCGLIGGDSKIGTLGLYIALAVVPLHIVAKLFAMSMIEQPTEYPNSTTGWKQRSRSWFAEQLEPNDTLVNLQSFEFKVLYVLLAILLGMELFVPEDWKFILPFGALVILGLILFSGIAAIQKLLRVMNEWDVI